MEFVLLATASHAVGATRLRAHSHLIGKVTDRLFVGVRVHSQPEEVEEVVQVHLPVNCV